MAGPPRTTEAPSIQGKRCATRASATAPTPKSSPTSRPPHLVRRSTAMPYIAAPATPGQNHIPGEASRTSEKSEA